MFNRVSPLLSSFLARQIKRAGKERKKKKEVETRKWIVDLHANLTWQKQFLLHAVQVSMCVYVILKVRYDANDPSYALIVAGEDEFSECHNHSREILVKIPGHFLRICGQDEGSGEVGVRRWRRRWRRRTVVHESSRCTTYVHFHCHRILRTRPAQIIITC